MSALLRCALIDARAVFKAMATTARSDRDSAYLLEAAERVTEALDADAAQHRRPTPYLPNPHRFADPSASEDKQRPEEAR